MRWFRQMMDYFKSFLLRSDIGQSRSAITNPLQWAIVILVAGTALLYSVHVPLWIVAMLGVCLLLVIALFIVTYIVCLIAIPDVLRSEHYALSKLAIEKGLVGDNLHGLVNDSDVVTTIESKEQKALPPGKDSSKGGS